jgi:diguanylate cyclase (GGDEF)-like protein
MCCPPDDQNDSNDAGEKTKVLGTDQETLNRDLQKAREQEACLILIRGTPQGHRFFLTLPEMTIGRTAPADIVINDQGVSRKHALVTNKPVPGQPNMVTLTDLGSSNGTMVNDKRLSKDQAVTLEKEDMIKLGNSILKFLPQGELEILMLGNLESAANTDPLTKIYNKRFLMEAIEAEFKRSKMLHTDLSLLFFDIDFFKKINDTHGHDAGDYVLKEFTSLIRSKYLREKDVFGRYGGEEFIILLQNTPAADAAKTAERVRGAIETHPFIYDGKRLPVTTSIGVAEISSSMESAQTLIKLSDKALYEAKNSGRNKVVVGR